MSRTVSARIPNEAHDKLLERCNRSGCTINEWLNASIDYLLTGSSDFDFGDEEEEAPEEAFPPESETRKASGRRATARPTLRRGIPRRWEFRCPSIF